MTSIKAKNALPALIASIGAFAAVLTLEMVIVFAAELHPRGPGWLVLPTIISIWVWRRVRATEQELTLGTIRARIESLNREGRFKLLFLISWVAAYLGYWIIEQPWGYRIRIDDIILFLFWLIVPPAAALLAYKAVRWAMAGDS